MTRDDEWFLSAILTRQHGVGTAHFFNNDACGKAGGKEVDAINLDNSHCLNDGAFDTRLALWDGEDFVVMR